MTNEHIKFAAIIVNNTIIYGKHHGGCIQRAASTGIADKKDNQVKMNMQGFLTSQLRFVFRKEAACLAYAACQIDNWKPQDELRSEHLYAEDMGGKFDYDDKLGYVRRK